jgi:hypothetical protein
MLSEIDDNEGYLQRVMFTDEATFHINLLRQSLQLQNLGITRTEWIFWVRTWYPKGERAVWTTRDRVVGPFFFVERNITRDIYLQLLEQFVFPQVYDIERENVTGVVFNKTAPCLISV